MIIMMDLPKINAVKTYMRNIMRNIMKKMK